MCRICLDSSITSLDQSRVHNGDIQLLVGSCMYEEIIFQTVFSNQSRVTKRGFSLKALQTTTNEIRLMLSDGVYKHLPITSSSSSHHQPIAVYCWT